MVRIPLSIRSGARNEDGPFDGLPAHLSSTVLGWVGDLFGTPDWADYTTLLKTQDLREIATRLRVPDSRDDWRTVRNWATQDEERALDLTDLALGIVFDEMGASWGARAGKELQRLLDAGGSVWRVDQDCLVRQVDAHAQDAYVELTESTVQHRWTEELHTAWKEVYGRNPDPSDGWDHAIKALEAALIPIVIDAPTGRETLGIVLRRLSQAPNIVQLELSNARDANSPPPGEILRRILKLAWANPDRHWAEDMVQPSLQQARSVVHLTVMVLQWVNLGLLRRSSN